MEKQFGKLGNRGDERREEASAEGIKYPPHIKLRLDNALAKIVDAKDDEERSGAMAEYEREMKKSKAEQERRMELVKFGDEQIHRFELEALQGIVDEINQDYAEQRIADPKFGQFDVRLDHLDLQVKVENNEVIKIGFFGMLLTRIPKSIVHLINITTIDFAGNRIEVIENLETLQNLEVIDFSKNNIRKVQGLGFVKAGGFVDLSDNDINPDEVNNIEELEKIREREIIINL